jgi:S1-C subfamily serine protease
MGTGVIIGETDDQVIIASNQHVVTGADTLSVAFIDETAADAQILGEDANTDLAVIAVNKEDLSEDTLEQIKVIEIGSSDKLVVGEQVVAIGNALGYGQSVSTGIVSALNRTLVSYDGSKEGTDNGLIQTDAAINPGNSGGALVNTKGELVGINTAIASQTGSYSGYAFAIPVSIMSKVVSDLKQYGTVQRALLGVMINDITAEFAKEKELSTLEGAYVAGINENSAAKEAGIEVGDIITEVNGTAVKSVSELQEQISRFSPGNNVEITLIRDKKAKTVNVVLKNQMGNTDIVKETNISMLGATLEPIDQETKSRYGINSGLVVTSVDKKGKFAENNIPEGFIIVKANNQNVGSVAELETIIKETKKSVGKFSDNALFLSGIYKNKVVYFAIDLN